jgi:hypothetical protein
MMIVCFNRGQAIELLKQETFEFDMGFKRVRERNINEIVLAAFIPGLRKSMLFYTRL